MLILLLFRARFAVRRFVALGVFQCSVLVKVGLNILLIDHTNVNL